MTPGRQVDGELLSQLFSKYVEQGETAVDNNVDSIYNETKHPLFGFLTSLDINKTGEELTDPRVIRYVLAHARRLKTLRLESSMPNLDDAFTRQLIGAPLEELDFKFTEITDVTIDVLCHQLATTLRSLSLCGCEKVTQKGLH